MKAQRIERRIARWLPVRFALVGTMGCIAIVLSPAQSPLAYGQVAPGYTFTTLAAFNGANGSDQSWSNLTLVGSTLYGTTSNGGPAGNGNIFSISTNGAGGINDLYDFPADFGTGGKPEASLIQVGGSLYGTAGWGGPNGSAGTIYSINANATNQGNANFKVVGWFPNNGVNADGCPGSGVTLVGTNLYGVNGFGNNTGSLYALPASSTGQLVDTYFRFNLSPPGSGIYSNLYGGAYVPAAVGIGGDAGDGFAVKTAGSTTTLYGVNGGGTNGAGVLYSVTLNSGPYLSSSGHSFNYNTLYSFTTSGTNDGSYPQGTLVLSPDGKTLYGMTQMGGTIGYGLGYNCGNIFSYNLTTGVYKDLWSFSGGTDGCTPYGSLTLSPDGKTLYGTTIGGAYNEFSGSCQQGNVFSINVDGSNMKNLYTFTGGDDGGAPLGSVTVSPNGQTLYGMTSQYDTYFGGAGGAGGNGTIFALALPSVTNGIWNNNGGGTWSDSGKWVSNSVPGGNALNTAVFGAILTSGTATVNMDGNNSLSSLSFCTTGTTSYLITGTSTLSFWNAGGAAATITNSGGSQTIAVPISLSSNLNVVAAGGSTLTVSGPISEVYTGMALSVSGGGTLILSGSSNYTGATTVNASTLQIGNGGSGEFLTSPSVTMSNNATVEFNHNDALWYGGTISGSGQFVKAGSGSLTLNGASTYNGPTTISAGTLVLGGAEVGYNLPTTTALNIASGGVLDMGANDQTVGSLGGTAGAIIMNNLVYSHTYTSTLTVNPTSGATTFAGNIVDSTLSSSHGNVALVLSGSGKLTLSGSNTYSGGTTVSGGTLRVANSGGSATGSGPVTVDAGATLEGSGIIGGPLEIAGALEPGDSPGIITVNNRVTFDSGSAFNAEVAGTTAGSGYDQLKTSGPVSLAGSLNLTFGTFTPAAGDILFLVNNTGSGLTTGTFQYADKSEIGVFDGYKWYITYEANDAGTPSVTGGNDVAIYTVPEPATLALLGVGAIGLVTYGWRRRRAKA